MYAKANSSSDPLRDYSRARRYGRTGQFGAAAARIRYRSAVTRRHDPDPTHIYYDGGDLSPYSLESLLDMVRAEARMPFSSLDVNLEINGQCSGAALREVALRFSELSILGLNVRIRAEGHATLVIATKNQGS